MYVDETDVAGLLSDLNSDEEIAFLVADGPGKWIARRSLESLGDGTWCLWHLPSGPLPLLPAAGFGVSLDELRPTESFVEDPWSGWKELRPGADRDRPYFGAGHPGVVDLDVRTWSRHEGGIGLSSFGWIGNHYRVLGRGAAKATEAWWTRLRRMPRRSGAKLVTRSGPVDGEYAEVWAFPSALARILSGVPRARNPW
jgi:hypothetical protein